MKTTPTDARRTEDTRLIEQLALDEARKPGERNKLGQYATPSALAEEIAACALSLLPPDTPIDFLEPALGTGAFFSALYRQSGARLRRATGFEIDAHYGAPAARLWRDTPLDVQIADFTGLTPPDTDDERFDLLLTNPPYVRHHHIEPKDKKRLQSRAEALIGERPSGLSGLYCHFVYLAHAWLREGALASWLIPSEFLDVGYGQTLKRYLLDKVTLLRVHRYDADDLQFGDALVSSCVLWYRKSPPILDHKIQLSFGGTHEHPRHCEIHTRADLSARRKWNEASLSPTPGPRTGSPPLRIGDVFKVKRGLATGRNSFFILTPEQAAEHKLPEAFLRPILPSPRHLPEDIIEADAKGAPITGPRLLLLDCGLHPEEVEAQHPTLWAYLRRGLEEGVADTYIGRHRRVWYWQEARPPAPFLCQYMGRKKQATGKLSRFFLNLSEATASNNLMMLYPKPPLSDLISQPDGKLALLELLSSISAGVLRENGRVYGGGLHKFEPGELGDVPVEGLRARLEEKA